MHRILVLGAGKIGSLIACLLAEQAGYTIHLGDQSLAVAKHLVEDLGLERVTPCLLDARQPHQLDAYLSAHPMDAVISSLPYFCNPAVAELARSHHIHYFDLTEDVAVTDRIRHISTGASTAFFPQCGLAPGFISIVTHDLMSHFEQLDTVKMRVGALPLHPSNALKYSLTWSTDGLINEYGNLCYGIEEGAKVPLQPLEGYETIELDGLLYEAFNTSGGLGTLADTAAGTVRTMNYKTLRYPGHCEKIHFLMKDLKLNEDRATLKRVLEHAIPQTLQDVVLIYASVSGTSEAGFFEENYVKKIYSQPIKGRVWSAIQVTTASSVCCVADLALNNPGRYNGFVAQESISLPDFLRNDFGAYYR
ncbi:L-lysine dehydrogenase [Nitrospira sp. KM1]|uniref:saccharopine dehydrogenase family protein n=1 Tax=Nitrospira sp. KM1 TaxID=1936990 RepID=UPI0013A7628B|nr:saccharopine dehydrogenase NADP-binding domain-containing protein [Nitrospira sp. KM1]BCA53597.1 L-lysine dehydrogenase [Nitrospira sp. KM1]